jgi:antitoxin YobK
MDLTKMFEILRAKENFTCGRRGATDTEIRVTEQSLGVTLPDSYVAFLKTFSFAWWFGHSIYGISEDLEEDIVAQTLKARNEILLPNFSKFPPNSVVIENYGGGGEYILYAKESPRSGEVVLLLDETWRKQEEGRWKSFEDFLAYALGVEQPQPLAS